MAKKGGSQTVTQKLDPMTQAYVGQVLGAGLAAAGLGGAGANATPDFGGGIGGAVKRAIYEKTHPGFGSAINGPAARPVPGVNPLTQEAIGNIQRAANLGLGGLAALGGDQAAIDTLMNPFTSNVIDAYNDEFDHIRNQTLAALDDAATKAGAFGGSRAAVAKGQALADLARTQASQVADLQYSGFNDAMQRAVLGANLGLGATEQLAQLGEYLRQIDLAQDPALRRIQILQMALGGVPFGTSTTQPVNRNAAAGLLGGAATGAGIAQALSLAHPLGWLATGIGGLLGLFG